MVKIWKVIGIVMSVLVIGALGFCGIWTVRNWNTVYSSFDGTSFYTYEDMQKLKQDTIEQCAKNEVEYKKVIGELRELISNFQNENSKLKLQVEKLTNTNNDYEIQIQNLLAEKAVLQNISNKLQSANEVNSNIIIDLNNQINSLNKQISDLSYLSENSQLEIEVLNNRISELQTTINCYENYISETENESKVVAIYEIDGSVWKVDLINKGEEINLVIPEDTDKYIFNGWKLFDNDTLLGTSYVLESNTRFVANITKKYAVEFIVDGSTYDTQFIIENETACYPEIPTKDGYEFLGWSINGVDLIENINSVSVTHDTAYHAVFTKIHTVTFIVEDKVVNTQKVSNGKYASYIDYVSQDFTINDWMFNGNVVDLNSFPIYMDAVLVADVLFNDWVSANFKSEILTFNEEYIWSDGTNCYYSFGTYHYIFDIETKSWLSIMWSGLTSFGGNYVWTDGVNIYFSSGADQYVLDKETKTWSTITWTGLTSFYGSYVWTDGVNTYYSKGANQYVLDINTKTWSIVTWAGLTSFNGSYVWTDGVNTYYSSGTNQYVLDINTKTWSIVTWAGLTSFNGSYVWTDGVNTYYSSGTNQYVLDINTKTWSIVTWIGLTNINGNCVWTDGLDIYYLKDNSKFYILDKSIYTWYEINFNYNSYNGLVDIDGDDIWTDGVNIYYSAGADQYVLDKETKTWSTMTWSGLTKFYGSSVWTDGTNFYYSYDTSHYKLDVNTKTWVSVQWNHSNFDGEDIFRVGTKIFYLRNGYLYEINTETYIFSELTSEFTGSHGRYVWTDGTNYYLSYKTSHYILNFEQNTAVVAPWSGLYDFYGYVVWTDGVNTYCSSGAGQYVLDKETKTWSTITWTGLTSFNGSYVWTDGENIYYSYGRQQYVYKANKTVGA